MLIHVLLLSGGLSLLVKSGDLFVSAAERIAESLRMPRVVIGAALVSLATTTPELVVSLIAGSRGEPDLAVGSVLGANIANLTLIAGSAATLSDVTMQRAAQLFNFPALLLWMSFDRPPRDAKGRHRTAGRLRGGSRGSGVLGGGVEAIMRPRTREGRWETGAR